jgi:hypothetical protein
MDRATWDGREEEEPAMRYHRPRRTGRWVIDLFAREWMTATDWVGLGTGHTKVAAAVCGSEICGRLICRGKAGEGASGAREGVRGGRAGTWVAGGAGNWIGWVWGGRREAQEDGLADAER